MAGRAGAQVAVEEPPAHECAPGRGAERAGTGGHDGGLLLPHREPAVRRRRGVKLITLAAA